ncbi:hypothetical protein [Bradyrhizobium japonicum]|nr:hypothetical protein [Bradyrhizobium japonicum]
MTRLDRLARSTRGIVSSLSALRRGIGCVSASGLVCLSSAM